MKVDHHTPYAAEDLVADPAEYAITADLVDCHDKRVFGKIGAWRWRLLHKHRERIIPLLTAGYSIDLGGAAAPVGYGAVVVDYQAPHDSPRALWDVAPDADCIFCSHTLEHFVDLPGAMAAIVHKLKPGGAFVCLVPSFQMVNLRAGNWPFHQTTFCLEADDAPAEFVQLDRLLLDYGFTLELAEYDSGNILVIGKLLTTNGQSVT